jgi:hypothetical protein
MKDEALKVALDALLINCGGNTEGIGKEAITACKQALAAPVQEPVAWLVEFENGEQELHFDEQSVGETNTPLYTTPPAQPAPVREDWGPGPHEYHSLPPAAQQEYERGVIDGRQMQAQSSVDKAVNAMSQRQWRGLTDKEFEEIIMSAPNATVPVVLWQLIQDKLKEKNT